MSKREAKRWACGMAAALVDSDMDMGETIPEDDPDATVKKAAMKELLTELRRRAGEE